MREVKFRGLRIDGSRFEYGSLVILDPPLQCFSSDKKDAPKYFIARAGSADWNMPRPLDMYEIKPKTVGQYTGLKDKNGKEIYKGDILRYNDGEDCATYLIEWWDEEGRWGDKRLEDGDSQTAYDGFDFVKDCIIIGNRYENPELL